MEIIIPGVLLAAILGLANNAYSEPEQFSLITAPLFCQITKWVTGIFAVYLIHSDLALVTGAISLESSAYPWVLALNIILNGVAGKLLVPFVLLATYVFALLSLPRIGLIKPRCKIDR